MNSAVLYDKPVSDSTRRAPPIHCAAIAENKKMMMLRADKMTTQVLS